MNSTQIARSRKIVADITANNLPDRILVRILDKLADQNSKLSSRPSDLFMFWLINLSIRIYNGTMFSHAWIRVRITQEKFQDHVHRVEILFMTDRACTLYQMTYIYSKILEILLCYSISINLRVKNPLEIAKFRTDHVHNNQLWYQIFKFSRAKKSGFHFQMKSKQPKIPSNSKMLDIIYFFSF